MFRGTRYVYLQSVWKRAYPWLTFILKELILSLHLAKHCSTTMPVQEHFTPYCCASGSPIEVCPSPDATPYARQLSELVPTCKRYAHHCIQNCSGQAQQKFTE